MKKDSDKKMKVFYQSKLAQWLLWQGYSTITLGCFVFSRLSREEMPKRVLNHEAIHVRQWKELTIASAISLTVIMLFTGFTPWIYLLCPLWFYLQYGIEYLFSRIWHLFHGQCGRTGNDIAYRNSAFEMEAKSNESIDGYLDVRVPFEFVRYYGRL